MLEPLENTFPEVCPESRTTSETNESQPRYASGSDSVENVSPDGFPVFAAVADPAFVATGTQFVGDGFPWPWAPEPGFDDAVLDAFALVMYKTRVAQLVLVGISTLCPITYGSFQAFLVMCVVVALVLASLKATKNAYSDPNVSVLASLVSLDCLFLFVLLANMRTVSDSVNAWDGADSWTFGRSVSFLLYLSTLWLTGFLTVGSVISWRAVRLASRINIPPSDLGDLHTELRRWSVQYASRENQEDEEEALMAHQRWMNRERVEARNSPQAFANTQGLDFQLRANGAQESSDLEGVDGAPSNQIEFVVIDSHVRHDLTGNSPFENISTLSIPRPLSEPLVVPPDVPGA